MPFERPITMWTIAGGVALGIITANVVEKITDAAILRIGLEYAAYQIQESTRQAQAQNDAAEKQRLENIAARQRAEYQARQAAINAKAKRDAAWAQFYHRDPKCDNNPIDDATFTKCANDSVKAKTTFDATYTP